MQQEHLIVRLQRVHDHLVESSKSISAAQEALESKLVNMFLSLDKVLGLQNALLLESRMIQSLLLYFVLIFFIYVITSTKKTYTVRHKLFIGLCATFLVEVSILRFTTESFDQQAWAINLVRYMFVILSAIQLLVPILTHRDNEVSNHQMLLTLMEKVNGMQKNEDLSTDYEDDAEEKVAIDWAKWIEEDLPEEVDLSEDPDYIPPVPEKYGGKAGYKLRPH